MSQSTTTTPIPAATVPVVAGTPATQKLLDWLKQPTTLAGLAGIIGAVAGYATHELSVGVALTVGLPALVGLLPDNSTDRIKVLDVANAIAANIPAGPAGKYDAVAIEIAKAAGAIK